jgi:hypothetical protein
LTQNQLYVFCQLFDLKAPETNDEGIPETKLDKDGFVAMFEKAAEAMEQSG